MTINSSYATSAQEADETALFRSVRGLPNFPARVSPHESCGLTFAGDSRQLQSVVAAYEPSVDTPVIIHWPRWD